MRVLMNILQLFCNFVIISYDAIFQVVTGLEIQYIAIFGGSRDNFVGKYETQKDEMQFDQFPIFFLISGGYRFFSDLLNKINALNTGMSAEASGKSLPVSMEFIRIKSYTNDR